MTHPATLSLVGTPSPPATATLAVRQRIDGAADEYLDWDDGAFKTSGWTEQRRTVAVAGTEYTEHVSRQDVAGRAALLAEWQLTIGGQLQTVVAPLLSDTTEMYARLNLERGNTVANKRAEPGDDGYTQTADGMIDITITDAGDGTGGTARQ